MNTSENKPYSPFNNFTHSNTYNKYVNATEDFLKSDSIVAKFAFVILILFVFVIILRIALALMTYFTKDVTSSKLINGSIDAKQLIVVPQDPSDPSTVTINRSVNASDGIEFTWSTWINIDNLTYNNGKYKCVFYKGNDYNNNPDNSEEGHQGLNFPNNAPGLYIAPDTNNLLIIMNTFNVINEKIVIENIPLHKWFNIMIRCKDTTLDVFINGNIVKSHNLHGVPKQNYGNVYIAPNGGFAGDISNLWYYNYALGTETISTIVKNGPNITLVSSNNNTKYDYLSLKWLFSSISS